ncbi:MAG: sigma 54-interacting transcriptional regulator [Myxococcota bacterium]|nr:sigma 54-interacting transcriptional regulator [Myxococcota bacterium]
MGEEASGCINGRYEILGHLGEGVEAIVLRARDVWEDRLVALKVLRYAAADSLACREFALLSAIDHPHLSRAYELGIVEQVEGPGPCRVGQAFFTQELIEGTSALAFVATLEKVSREDAVLRIGLAVCEALSVLHGQGLVHRDVKPGNILIETPFNRPRLIDLGLAWTGDFASLAKAGTVAYMAPESFEGVSDEATDVYSLGITLAELLGQAPSARPLRDTPPDGCSQRLWAVVRRLASRDRRHRPSSAVGAHRLLERVDEGREKEETPGLSERRRLLCCPVLLEREDVTADLTSFVLHALRDDGRTPRLAVVHGTEGSGKDRLLRRALAEVQVALSPKPDLLPAVVRGPLIETLEKLASLAPLGGVREPQRKWDGLSEIADFLSALSRPAVLCLEGLANPTLELLQEHLARLGRSRRGPGLVLVVKVSGRLPRLVEHGACPARFFETLPLSREGLSKLVELMSGKAPRANVVEALVSLTGGVPLLAEAVVGAALAHGGARPLTEAALRVYLSGQKPTELLAIAASRVFGDGPSRALAEVMAIADVPLRAEEIVTVAAISDVEAATDTLRHLSRTGAVRRDADGRLGIPGLVAQAVRETLSVERARSIARALLAHALRDHVGSLQQARWARLADDRDAGRLASELAAQLAEACADYETAVEAHRLRLDWLEDTERTEGLLELARVLRLTGQYEAVLEITSSLRGLAGRLGAAARLEQARAARLSGNDALAADALAQMPQDAEEGQKAQATALSMRMALDRGDESAALELARTVTKERLWQSSGQELAVPAALTLLAAGEFDQARTIAEEGLSVAAKRGDKRLESRLQGVCGMLHHSKAQFEAAACCFRWATELADKTGDRHGGATYQVNLAAALTETGHLDEALSAYAEGISRLCSIGRPEERLIAAANRAQLLVRLGDVETALASCKTFSVELDECSASPRTRAVVHRLWGDVLAAADHVEEAQLCLGEALQAAETAGDAREIWATRLLLSSLALRCAKLEDAGKWLELDGVLLEDSGAQTERLRLLVELGLALGAVDASALEELSARTRAESSLRSGPEVLSTLARAHFKAGDNEKAEHLARTPLETLGGESSRWEKLARLLGRLNEQLRLGPLLETVMDTAIEIADAERGFLLVVGKQGDLRIRCARNLDARALAQNDRDFSRSVAVQAFESRSPAMTTDAMSDERFRSARSVIALELRAVAAVPMLLRGDAIGAIYVDSRRGRAFDPETARLLQALADQAAVCLHNATLLAENRRRRREVERLARKLEAKLDSSQAEIARKERELNRRTDELVDRYRAQGIVGASKAMSNVYAMIDRLARSDLPLVVLGESGTGKELVARAVHYSSERARRPFVAENCAAVPSTLLESILFGHVRGAFTGAVRDSEGLFVQAHGGTLLLDEVGEMPLDMQVKLLRVLEDGVVRPLGGAKVIEVDVRVVVATNSDLRALVDAGRFRADLFYRLSVVGKGASVSESAMGALCRFPWPGNARQLRNEVQRALALSGGTISLEHLSTEVSLGRASVPSFEESDLNLKRRTEELKQRLVEAALAKSRGNQSEAARLLGLSRFGLSKMLSRFER